MTHIWFFYHHFGGLGHGTRVFAICKALRQEFPDSRVLVFNYGRPQPESGIQEAATVINMPAFRDWGLFDRQPSKVQRALMRKKRTVIINKVLGSSRPDLVIFEHYPFGRQALKEEWDGLLKTFANIKVPVYASVRDIVTQSLNKKRLAYALSIIKAVFVHADTTTGFIAPKQAAIAGPKIMLTGRVIPSLKRIGSKQKNAIRAKYVRRGEKLIIVNTGGGMDGGALLQKLARIAGDLHGELKARLLIAAGPSIPDKEFARLEKMCKNKPYITLKKFIPGFHDLACASDLYLSMGGYNSINSILFEKINAIVFPRLSDEEQKSRCHVYRNCFKVMDYKKDPEETIYRQIKRRLACNENNTVVCDFNGATRTARLIHACLNIRLVKIRLTTECNCSCEMCSWKKKPESLPLDLVKKTIDQAGFLNLSALNFTGGEPTLYPGFFAVLGHARKKGFRISLSTNGVIDKPTLRRLGPLIDFMDISIDSADGSLHDKIRNRRGAFRKAIETARWAAGQKKSVRINSVLRPDNFEDAPDIIPLLASEAVSFSFALADTTQNSLPNLRFKTEQLEKLYLETSLEILKNAAETGTNANIKPFFPDLEGKQHREALWHLTKYGEQYREKLKDIFSCPANRCGFALSTMRINTNGDISPCCSLDDYASPIGNIFKNSLPDIIASDRYADFINSAVPGRGPCARCREGYRIYCHDFDQKP